MQKINKTVLAPFLMKTLHDSATKSKAVEGITLKSQLVVTWNTIKKAMVL
jgi:hypothetical protein